MNEFYKTLNYEGKGPKSRNDFIKLNKQFSLLTKPRTKSNKTKRCVICKKTGIKYCNSHTIPQFILKNICKDGKMLNTQSLNSTKFKKEEDGINVAQVFHSICTSCDNLKFKEYESIENYKTEPSQLILKQIALKNHLYSSYKHNKEKALYNNIVRDIFGSSIHLPENHPLKYMLKVTEHNYCYNNKRANLIIKHLSDNTELYKLCYFKKLNYVIPIALQDNSIISYGFNNEKLANTFDFPSLDYADDVHFCIYPMENESIIMLFCAKDLSIYDKFFKTLRNLDEKEQLSIINFLIFAYFEEVFLCKELDKSIFENVSLRKLSQEQLLTISNPEKILKLTKEEQDKYQWDSLNNFNISNHCNIPNLLDISQKIR